MFFSRSNFSFASILWQLEADIGKLMKCLIQCHWIFSSIQSAKCYGTFRMWWCQKKVNNAARIILRTSYVCTLSVLVLSELCHANDVWKDGEKEDEVETISLCGRNVYRRAQFYPQFGVSCSCCCCWFVLYIFFIVVSFIYLFYHIRAFRTKVLAFHFLFVISLQFRVL